MTGTQLFGGDEQLAPIQGFDEEPTGRRGNADHPASRFLGREFLLWLWWRTERDFGTLEVPGAGSVDLWVDDHIQFRTAGDAPQVADLRGGAPATTLEAKMAIAAGKTVESARLGLRVKEREYLLGLQAEGFQLVGVKVPAEIKGEAHERVLERMFLLEEVEGILDQLFGSFVAQRVSPEWNSEVLPSIRSWVSPLGEESPPSAD